MEIVWLPVAASDRDGLIDYISDEDPRAAIEQGDRIERSIDLLADYPEIGRVGRVNGTRELVVPRTAFVVIYRLNRPKQRVEILRILHGAMQ